MVKRDSVLGHSNCTKSSVEMFSRLCKIIVFRSLNTIFGKVGKNASEEIILELIRSKCIPIE